MKIKQFVFVICLLLIPNLVFSVVDSSKSYSVGVKAYDEGNLKKAVRFLENAIDAGLSANRLDESYCKLYFCAFELKDQKRLSKYESLCSHKNLTLHITFEGLKSIDEKNTLLIKDILTKRLKENIYKKHTIEVVKKGDRIVYIISVFKVDNPQKVLDIVAKSGDLKLALVDDKNNLMDALKGNMPHDSKILYQIKHRNETIQKIPFLIKNKVWSMNSMIAKTKIHIDKKYNTPNIIIELDRLLQN